MSNVSPVVADFLKAVEQTQASSSYNVWVPTQESDFRFKPLSVNQQKRIIASAAASANRAYQTPFKIEVKKVLAECCPDLPIDNLIRYDIDAILVQIRAKTFGDVYASTLGDLDLTELIKIYANLKVQDIFGDVAEPSENTISLTLGVPTFAREIEYEKTVSKPTEKSDEQLGSVISEVFVAEISKHISAITIGDRPYNLYQMKVSDAVQLVESLPSSLFNTVLAEITRFKNNYENMTKFGEKKVNVEIDATFFATK